MRAFLRGSAVACLVLAIARPAAAQTFLAPDVGGPVFTGPTSPHVSSIFWNPAATGLMDGFHGLVSATGSLDRQSVARRNIDAATGEPAGGTGAEVTSTPFVPGGFVGFSFSSNARVSAGLAVYTLYAEEQPDAAGLGYHARGGSLYAHELAVGGSLRISRTLYIGVSIRFLTGLDLDVRYDRDRPLEDCTASPCPAPESAGGAQSVRLSVDDFIDGEWRVNFGALLKVQRLWIGAAYLVGHGQTTSGITRFGTATVSGGGLAAPVSGEARINLDLPGMLHVGARHPVGGGWDALLHFRWIDISRHDALDIRFVGEELQDAGLPEWTQRYRGLEDVYSLEAGIENGVTARFRGGARLRWETSSVETARVSPAVIDSQKVVLGLGGHVRLTRWLGFGVGYSLGYFFEQDVEDSVFKPSSREACVASGFDLDACADVAAGRAIPTAAGTYNRLTHDFTVTLTFDRW